MIVMERFVFPPYNFNMFAGCGPYTFGSQKSKPPNWNKKGSVYIAPDAADYLDMYKRAQLKAILSQVNPSLTPRVRKTNTREFGVQVNPKVDAVTQCSLGPKTLFYCERNTLPSTLPQTPVSKEELSPGTPANVRFSRPVAIYSPVFDRRFFTLPDDADEGDFQERAVAEKGEEESQDDKVTETLERPQGGHVSTPHISKKFHFQKYGFFHCSQCNIRWESAYVWCISGTNKVYFKQFCRKCQIGYNPYRVESIQCQGCNQTRCSCDNKKRHIDMKRPHRQDLCGRCRGKRLSCDTTYSFKYIV